MENPTSSPKQRQLTYEEAGNVRDAFVAAADTWFRRHFRPRIATGLGVPDESKGLGWHIVLLVEKERQAKYAEGLAKRYITEAPFAVFVTGIVRPIYSSFG